MLFKWIVLGFLIAACFCKDKGEKCPGRNYTIPILKFNNTLICPYLCSPYSLKNGTKVCCDNLKTCGSRLGFKSDDNNQTQCQHPKNINMHLPERVTKKEHWFNPAKDKYGFYKECGHNYNCDETQYCHHAHYFNGTTDVQTYDSAGNKLKYCFNKPASYYMTPGRTCNKGDNSSCLPGYCKDTRLKFHMCAHPMQNYCEGQYPAVNHKVECKTNATCPINGTYCGETDDGRKTCCAARPKHITTNRTCNLGLMVLPRRYCKFENNCGNGGKGVLTRWCDYDSQVCCEVNKQEPYWKYYCPDNQTPIYGQPPCNGTDKCYGAARGIEGTCVNGRCCPTIVYNPFHEQYSKMPVMPFVTEVPCNASKRTNWRFAYCDETYGKMVSFSENSVSGWAHVLIPMKCGGNLDCQIPWFSYSSPVCVHVSPRQSYCVATPLKPMLLIKKIWYRNLSEWFNVLHHGWWFISAFLAIYSYYDWYKRNRSSHELN